MSTQYQGPGDDSDVSGWAVGGAVFAATILCIAGIFQILTGLVAVLNDEFFVVTKNYTFDLDVSTWGWIHLVVGALVLATGIGLMSRAPWAGVTTILIASLSAIVNFFFIPYYPIWSLVVIGLNIWVIWAVTRPGVLNE